MKNPLTYQILKSRTFKKSSILIVKKGAFDSMRNRSDRPNDVQKVPTYIYMN
jgi:hypothetical protein